MAEEAAQPLPSTERLAAMLAAGHRFCIINCWRNAGRAPVGRAPLALLAARYAAAPAAPAAQPAARFPEDSPDSARSRWYAFPSMTPEEVRCGHARSPRAVAAARRVG